MVGKESAPTILPSKITHPQIKRAQNELRPLGNECLEAIRIDGGWRSVKERSGPVRPGGEIILENSTRQLLVTVAVAFVVACTRDVPRSVKCPPGETSIVVSTGAHELAACKDGKAELLYAVALGRGGTGKTLEGDRKTPLGDYPLGPPRPSKKFHTFIPIGYPTERQSRAGLTGSHVGIHGPSRYFGWLGSSSVWMDWTLGCIALGSDAEIDALAAWVAREQPIAVRLR